jgi:hypothetical protein
MNIRFDVDTTQLNRLAVSIATMRNRFPEFTAKAMTFAAYDARKQIQRETSNPNFIDNPTTWTRNSTFVKPASPANLIVSLGFKDEAVKGTPAAKYLQPMVAGEARPQKSFEKQLYRSGLLRPGEYTVPTGVYPLKLNRYGNIPGPTYVQVLSRLRALGEQGYTGNVSGSRRSQAKRSNRDFFIGTPGGLPRGIYARVGRKSKTTGIPTGFHTVFYITKQPRYQRQFPVQDIAQQEFSKRFPSIFERLVFSGK